MVPPLPRWSGPGTEGRWLRDGQQLGTGNCLSRFPPPNRSQRASKHAKISPNYVEKTPEIGRFATLWPLPNRTFCIRMYPCNPSFSLHRPLLRRLSHPSRTICRISALLQPYSLRQFQRILNQSKESIINKLKPPHARIHESIHRICQQVHQYIRQPNRQQASLDQRRVGQVPALPPNHDEGTPVPRPPRRMDRGLRRPHPAREPSEEPIPTHTCTVNKVEIKNALSVG